VRGPSGPAPRDLCGLSSRSEDEDYEKEPDDHNGRQQLHLIGRLNCARFPRFGPSELFLGTDVRKDLTHELQLGGGVSGIEGEILHAVKHPLNLHTLFNEGVDGQVPAEGVSDFLIHPRGFRARRSPEHDQGVGAGNCHLDFGGEVAPDIAVIAGHVWLHPCARDLGRHLIHQRHVIVADGVADEHAEGHGVGEPGRGL
jgi:hypothetical protein